MDRRMNGVMMPGVSLLVLILFWVAACAHLPSGLPTASSTVPPSGPEEVQIAGNLPSSARAEQATTIESDDRRHPYPTPVGFRGSLTARSLTAAGKRTGDPENGDFLEEADLQENDATIADPLEPFNRAMFQFNDKLYFWALKPLAQGYKKVVPEIPRKGVENFFSNLAFPIRFVSCLLQGDVKSAASEFGRFAVNTLWGVGGFLDPASSDQLAIPKRDADFGQTLGVYGLGPGLFIVWPVLGPSSARDTVGIVGDFFLDPVSYLSGSWYDFIWIKAFNDVNDTSLRLGDYESFLGAAIDPYVALRDAYFQYRLRKIHMGRGESEPDKPAGIRK